MEQAKFTPEEVGDMERKANEMMTPQEHQASWLAEGHGLGSGGLDLGQRVASRSLLEGKTVKEITEIRQTEIDQAHQDALDAIDEVGDADIKLYFRQELECAERQSDLNDKNPQPLYDRSKESEEEFNKRYQFWVERIRAFLPAESDASLAYQAYLDAEDAHPRKNPEYLTVTKAENKIRQYAYLRKH